MVVDTVRRGEACRKTYHGSCGNAVGQTKRAVSKNVLYRKGGLLPPPSRVVIFGYINRLHRCPRPYSR